jgi:hypothetical protein
MNVEEQDRNGGSPGLRSPVLENSTVCNLGPLAEPDSITRRNNVMNSSDVRGRNDVYEPPCTLAGQSYRDIDALEITPKETWLKTNFS